MEFPTAMLGVALGVVLMPQLAARQGAATTPSAIRPCSTGACAWCVLLAVPGVGGAAGVRAAAGGHAVPLRRVPATATCSRSSLALAGYGVGLLGLVAIKVLAPGFYASQDMRTPVRIAIVVLVLTQLLNIALVPLLQHAGLALSIGLGALINAGWLLVGLLRRGSYKPAPGWGRVRCCRWSRPRALLARVPDVGARTASRGSRMRAQAVAARRR